LIKAFTESTSFKEESDGNAKQALKELAMIRTHPEFQFLFKYKSASGFLNENKSKEEKTPKT